MTQANTIWDEIAEEDASTRSPTTQPATEASLWDEIGEEDVAAPIPQEPGRVLDEADAELLRSGIDPEALRRRTARMTEPLPPEEIDSRFRDALFMAAGPFGKREELPTLTEKMPFVGAAAQALNQLDIYAAAKRIEAGTATADDLTRVARFMVQRRRMEDRGFWEKVLDVGTDIPGFALEFGLTGPVYAATKGAAKRGVTRALGGVAERAAGRVATATVPRIFGVSAHAAANPQLVAEMTARRLTARMALGADESGAVVPILLEGEEDFLAALPKGFLQSMIELGSERGGEMFSRVIGRQQLVTGLKAAAARRWLNNGVGRKMTDLQELLRKGGWHGPFNEILEERLNEVATMLPPLNEKQGVMGYFAEGMQDLTEGNYSRAAKFAALGLEQLGVEAVAFSAFAGAARGVQEAGRITGGMEGRREIEDLYIPREPWAAEDFSKPDMAQFFVARYPELANEVLEAKEPISRRNRAMRSIARFPKDTEEARKTVVDALRTAKETQDARQVQEVSEEGEAAVGREGEARQPARDLYGRERGEREAVPEAEGREAAEEAVIDEWELRGLIEQPAPRPVSAPEAAVLQDEWAARGLDMLGDHLEAHIDEGVKPAGEAAEAEVESLLRDTANQAVKLGITKFDDFARLIARRVGPGRAQALEPPMQAAWNQVREDNPELGESSSVTTAVKGIGKVVPIGRPDLAMPTEQALGKTAVATVQELKKLAGLPERRHDDVVDAEAARMLARDREGVEQSVIDKSYVGAEFGEDLTVAAKMLIDTRAVEAAETGRDEDWRRVVGIYSGYQDGGTDLARKFRQRRSRSIWEFLVALPDRKRKKVNKLRRQGKPDEAQELIDDWSKQVKDINEELKAIGINLAVDADRIGENPVETAKIMRVIAVKKASRFDWAYELWLNGILSAIPTQAVNLGGNWSHTFWSMAAERQVERLINLIVRSPEAAQFGEIPHMAKKLVDPTAIRKIVKGEIPWSDFTQVLRVTMPAMSHAAQNFWRTWQDETPRLDVELGRTPTGKWGALEEPGREMRFAIGGKGGRAWRWPTRLLMAADDMSKAFIVEFEVVAQAYRMAKAEGYRGEALGGRMAELTQDVGSEAWKRAYQRALELTFQERSDTLRNVLRLRRGPFKFLIPFVTTPWNIVRLGLRKSPLGVLPLTARTVKAARTGEWGTWPKYAAEQLLAWGAMLAIGALNDPDDPIITGAAAEADPEQRAELGRYGRVRPSQSIKLGGTWWSYARVEPMATAISPMVDLSDAWKRGDWKEMPSTLWRSLLGQVKEKTYLRGVSDTMKALEADLGREGLWGMARSFAASWVPNLVRSVGRAAEQEHKPLRRVWGKGEERWWRRLRRLLQQTELGIIPDVPDYDLWGRPFPRSKDPVFGSDFLYRATSPIYNRPAVPAFVGDVVLMNWNNDHPEVDYHPEVPRPQYKVRGELAPRYLTDEQQSVFMRFRGRLAALLVTRVAQSRGWQDPERTAHPTVGDRMVLARALSGATAGAKANLEGFWRRGESGAERATELIQQYEAEMMQSGYGSSLLPGQQPR